MTFEFENIFFHLIHSKEFVAEFRVRVVWNCDATVRTWGAFGPPTVRYLAHNHRSEPKFEQIFEGFKGEKNLFKLKGHQKIFKTLLNF
jgi:hypothetical protein